MSNKYDSEEARFMANWYSAKEEMDLAEKEWIEKLRSEGVKASHPDDGWIDRVNDIANFCYPHFDDGVDVGDVIALGSYDEYRYVKVTYRILGWGECKYKFEPLDIEEPPKKLPWWRRLFSRDR